MGKTMKTDAATDLASHHAGAGFPHRRADLRPGEGPDPDPRSVPRQHRRIARPLARHAHAAQETQVLPRAERLRSVSVPKAVAAFLVAGLLVLTAVGLVLALALR